MNQKQMQDQIASLQQQLAMERESHAERIADLRTEYEGGAGWSQDELRAKIEDVVESVVAYYEARIARGHAMLHKVQGERDEALRWQGLWKSKYNRMMALQARDARVNPPAVQQPRF